jgi:pyruvate dehydrogenase E2 component (dihydrolipoamide acetyltransferase)
MAEVVRMPKLSDTMTEGVVAEWHKKVGDHVDSGDLLAEIETDKATMEFESFQEGVLLHIGVDQGQTAPVDSILAILGEEGEDVEAILKEEENSAPAAEAPVKEEAKPAETPAPSKPAEAAPAPQAAPVAFAAPVNNGKVKASPLAKKMAEEKGINIAQVTGSGDGGRVVKRDIENFVPGAAASAPAFGQESYTDVPVSQMRKTIARRLGESKFSAPHFYLTVEIDMDNAIAARKAVNEVADVKVSFNDFVVKASALALKQHPAVNSAWYGDTIRFNDHVHVGVAVAVDEGLLVPVIRFADTKSLSQISKEVKELAGKARDKKLQPAEWEGNTFSISNLGMFGIEEFTAIINPPDSCIMAVGGIIEKPVVKNGQVVPGNRMKVTLSCDHRTVDGASGAAFLNTFKAFLENPITMMA